MDGKGKRAAGEVVYLASELSAGGAIHEIGTRALVLEDRTTALALEVGGHAVTCPCGAVAPRRGHVSRASAWGGRPTRVRPALG
jgi:hypothetical protein